MPASNAKESHTIVLLSDNNGGRYFINVVFVCAFFFFNKIIYFEFKFVGKSSECLEYVLLMLTCFTILFRGE